MHMQASDSLSIGELSSAWSQAAGFVSAMDATLGKWLTDAHGVGLTEYRALALLTQAADKELRVSDLAQRVGLNQSSATRLVSRLEAKGLTRRDVCPDDGRGVYAVITERGEGLTRAIRGPYEKRIAELLTEASAHVPQLDVHQLSRALQNIAQQVAP